MNPATALHDSRRHACRVLTCPPATLRARLGLFAPRKCIEDLDRRFRRQVFVIVVTDGHHCRRAGELVTGDGGRDEGKRTRRVTACTKTLDLDQRKLAIGRRVAWGNVQVLLNRFQDRI